MTYLQSTNNFPNTYGFFNSDISFKINGPNYDISSIHYQNP